MNKLAMRSVCNKARPPSVLDVKKKVRTGLRAESNLEFRDGLAMTGAEARQL